MLIPRKELERRRDRERERDRERALAYAAKQQRKSNWVGYFMKFDELQGVLACPGVKLPSLQNSSFVPNYIDEMKDRIFGDRLEEVDMRFN